MVVKVAANKRLGIKDACNELLQLTNPRIRFVAEVTGKLVAACPGVQMGQLYYRQLENEKISALRLSHGNFEARMTLSDLAKSDLKWWVINIDSTSKPLSLGNPDFAIWTDASDAGFGFSRPDISVTNGDTWKPDEAGMHINVKEITAVWFALKALCPHERDKHIKVFTDNMTTLAYIRDFGGSHSLQCNEVARKIWVWARDRDLWISIAHVPGVDNVTADRASRHFDHETEWMLDPDEFRNIMQHYPKFDIKLDLFASRKNYQLDRFISWKPDPDAEAVDAFTLNWGTETFYAFPPFSIISRVLQKIIQDKTSGILVVPDWPTQPWYATVRKLLIDKPHIIQARKHLLRIPGVDKLHPLWKRIKLLACPLSGSRC
ncbi:uncharacterized protein LOC135494352 [Lineus longissimus]|uniref:uncharacterized protein LOC135494352 n=1 Tax=Lineus longissimus TaxID=88925 RepID=UPI00315C8BA4